MICCQETEVTLLVLFLTKSSTYLKSKIPLPATRTQVSSSFTEEAVMSDWFKNQLKQKANTQRASAARGVFSEVRQGLMGSCSHNLCPDRGILVSLKPFYIYSAQGRGRKVWPGEEQRCLGGVRGSGASGAGAAGGLGKEGDRLIPSPPSAFFPCYKQ